MHPTRINYIKEWCTWCTHFIHWKKKRAISCIWKANCWLLTGWSTILVTFVETLVTLQPVTPSRMLIHAPSFKHTRISTLRKERWSRLGEKLNPQFQSRVSTFDDYCTIFARENKYIQGFLCKTRGPGASLYTDTDWWIRRTNMAAREFGVSLLASRWSQITDSTTKNMNF